MPFPLSPGTRSGPRRRILLAVAPAALLAAGCSAGSDDSGTPRGNGPSAADRARARAARDSRELAARYDAVIAAHPGLAERLRPLHADVVRHAEAFGPAPSPSPSSSSPSAASSPSGAATPSGTGAGESAAPVSPSSPVPPSSGAVPATPKEALADLAAAERELAGRRTRALLEAPGELARLLASAAAAGAAHVYLLTEGRA
ncbi:hypothetical protein [Streptomyces sp. enrichment culture]|uniref:hypothetical protein n=1 Tax=Streptomyces sp. enrichment culture TaxID=1795815 RepID=UPI003F57EC1D